MQVKGVASGNDCGDVRAREAKGAVSFAGGFSDASAVERDEIEALIKSARLMRCAT